MFPVVCRLPKYPVNDVTNPQPGYIHFEICNESFIFTPTPVCSFEIPPNVFNTMSPSFNIILPPSTVIFSVVMLLKLAFGSPIGGGDVGVAVTIIGIKKTVEKRSLIAKFDVFCVFMFYVYEFVNNLNFFNKMKLISVFIFEYRLLVIGKCEKIYK